MKSKLKTIVLAFLALFVFSANFFCQDNEEQAPAQEQQVQSQEEESQAQEQESGEEKTAKSKKGKKSKKNKKQAVDEEDAPDDYDDDLAFVYQQNAAGDQNINIRVMPNFPLNFEDRLYVGGQITVGYNRFLTSWFAVGAELAFGYNPTLGSNILTYVPMTIGATFLPAIKKFEFPITVNIGMTVINYLSYTYFPGLVVRCGAGCYYRISESWSVGVEGFFTYMPEWHPDQPEKNDNLNYASVSAGVKYHF